MYDRFTPTMNGMMGGTPTAPTAPAAKTQVSSPFVPGSAGMSGGKDGPGSNLPAPTPLPKINVAAAKKVEPSKPAAVVSSPKKNFTMVTKDQLAQYRKDVGNQNATLGQYMNDLKGKTAIAGGKNDPSVIQKTLKAGQKAFDPTTSSGNYGDPKAPTVKTTSSVSPAPAPKVEPTSAPLPSMASSGGGASNDAASGAAKMNTMNSLPKAPEATGSVSFKDSSNRPKAPSSMVAESTVSVGDNKYRIV